MKALAHYAFLRRRGIVVLAVICAAVAAAYGASVFDRAEPFGFSDPDSESSRAYDLLEDLTGEQVVPGVLLLVEPEQPPETPIGSGEVTAVARELSAIEGIARVEQPGTSDAPVSEDGRVALVQGTLDSSVDDLSDVGERVTAAFGDRDGVEVGGLAVASVQLNETTEEDLRTIELYAAPLLLLISLFVFRSVVAAMLPLIVGAFSIAFTLAALRALSETMVIDIFALNVVTVLGFGLAIDYSLFMVSRYREELARAGPGGAALWGTMVPVGRMICFSAVTVAAAVASLAVFPQRFLYSTGVGCAIVALVSAAVVLLVLPAVLALLGERVNALGLPALPKRSSRWRGIAALVSSRPSAVAIVAATVMVIAGLPFLRAELTRADARVLPEDDSARVVDQTTQKRFKNDPSASMLVVLPEPADPASTRAGRQELESLDGVLVTTPAQAPRGVEVVEARISPSPYSDAAVDLVRRARAIEWGADALVAGTSAELVDQRESVSEHLPLAVALVIATTLIILLLMTGSVVLPLLTVIANALTISVAFGVLVLIFQDGRLEGPLAYSGVSALDISVPILLFAVVFGLSTDYGVFLISRMGEARREGAGDSEAVALGLERSGRIITAAALLFAVAMGAFVFSQMIFIKEVAVGTAVAVLVDATLVRALLLPAMMLLCGRWTWWAPGPLKRLGQLRA